MVGRVWEHIHLMILFKRLFFTVYARNALSKLEELWASFRPIGADRRLVTNQRSCIHCCRVADHTMKIDGDRDPGGPPRRHRRRPGLLTGCCSRRIAADPGESGHLNIRSSHYIRISAITPLLEISVACVGDVSDGRPPRQKGVPSLPLVKCSQIRANLHGNVIIWHWYDSAADPSALRAGMSASVGSDVSANAIYKYKMHLSFVFCVSFFFVTFA